jgi:hypothetical protein
VTSEELIALLPELFGETAWPKPLHLLQAVERVAEGEDLGAVARSVGTTANRLRNVLRQADRVAYIMGSRPEELEESQVVRSRRMLGQLLLGRCAERAFEDIYATAMGGHEFRLVDQRESRTDTDYRVYDDRDRPVYRINIKFHGSRFRRAPELVSLDPENCFALATYKIYGALQKQQEERLPYFFAVVGVSHLTGEEVGRQLPQKLVEGSAFIHQAPKAINKRAFEDAVVAHIVAGRLPVSEHTYIRILEAPWYILSARKADKLLRNLLFERVYALRVRGFAQVFRGAELDMHFSLRSDLTPLNEFLRVLREEGATKVATLLERGEF